MLREWVAGMKVVLADGTLLAINGSLVKNQTGYDLRSLFIGSEGTLGIIVEVTLKLTTPPGEVVRLVAGLPGLGPLLETFRRMRDAFPFVNAFEYFSREALDEVLTHHQLQDPFREHYPTYILVELETSLCGGAAAIEEKLVPLIEEGLVSDLVMSRNGKEADALLSLRERISETLSARHTLHKNDISVPIPALSDFLGELVPLIETRYPGFKVILFGHVGDGNLHVNLLKPPGMEKDAFFSFCKGADHDVFALVQRYQGSISAEHGVGLLKRDYLHYSRTPAELALMRAIKGVFDPRGIMNPGKIFAD
jgi:FAD/FMN-containing dehydrogenase